MPESLNLLTVYEFFLILLAVTIGDSMGKRLMMYLMTFAQVTYNNNWEA